jgi:uncharacterized protein (TIGR00290 family)
MDVALAWSTGKDAALALDALAADPDCEVVELFTTLRDGRVRGHGVPRELVDRQADALGYPLRAIALPEGDGTDGYERHLRATFDAYARRGIDRVVYADLFVESIREYREGLLADAAIEGWWPLWGRETRELAEWFCDEFAATVARVDGDVLDETATCRRFDRSFLADLPEGADPCGEHGAFHTFVTDGPVFDHPVAVESVGRHTETVERGSHGGTYHYCDLRPA